MSWATAAFQVSLPCVLTLMLYMRRPSSRHSLFAASVTIFLTVWAVSPDLARLVLGSTYFFALWLLLLLHPDLFIVKHAGNLLIVGAGLWLVRRATQTLWKPIPELINILGVEVPETPELVLSTITAESVSLQWSKPPPNRPVQKFQIMVNDINVGETGGQETAILVTGLKAEYFYNVRVIAVGLNGFQTGSQTARLRMLSQDFALRLAACQARDIPARDMSSDQVEDRDSTICQLPSIEATTPSACRSRNAATNSTATAASSRRDTLNQSGPPLTPDGVLGVLPKSPLLDNTNETLSALNARYEKALADMEDHGELYRVETGEFDALYLDLQTERDSKRQKIKEKEDITQQLKAQSRKARAQTRATERDKAKIQQLLKDVAAKHFKIQDNTAQLESETEQMRIKQVSVSQDTLKTQKEYNATLASIRRENKALQTEGASLESELKQKGKNLTDLKSQRQKFLGSAEDQAWKASTTQIKMDCDLKRRELYSQTVHEVKRGQQLENQLKSIYARPQAHQAQGSLSLLPRSSPVVSDPERPAPSHTKRRSQATNPLSIPPTCMVPSHAPPPHNVYFPSSVVFPSKASFGASVGQQVDLQTVQSPGLSGLESYAIKCQPGPCVATTDPLSPSATSLLPSGIFGDDEALPSSSSGPRPQISRPDSGQRDPQSPASSNYSFSGMTSPHDSAQLSPFPMYTMDHTGEVVAAQLHKGLQPTPPIHRLANLLHPFQRSRGIKAGSDESQLPSGQAKIPYTQSFPNQDNGEVARDRRRTSLSGPWFNRSSTSGDLGQGATGNRDVTHMRLNHIANSRISLYAERDPASPRPASIASDLTRPSTDNGSIWGPSTDQSHLSKNRMWTAPDSIWSSHTPSRRPSLHGPYSLLETHFASADDDILDNEALLDPQVSPSLIGVIGSRPLNHGKPVVPRLNPAAPTFMTTLFKKSEIKDKDGDDGRDREKPKLKDKLKDKSKVKSKDKSTDKDKEGGGRDQKRVIKEAVPITWIEGPQVLGHKLDRETSLSASRLSRDAHPNYIQGSVTRSGELQNHLESMAAELPTEPVPDLSNLGSSASPRDQETGVRKLFRKSSSGKFSLTSRLGKDSNMFKKGSPGGADRTAPRLSSQTDRSSLDLDDWSGENSAIAGGGVLLGPVRGADSTASSPRAKGSKDGKEGRMTSWRFSKKKKGRDTNDGSELERPTEVDLTTLMD